VYVCVCKLVKCIQNETSKAAARPRVAVLNTVAAADCG
jgi:hypothetical protein